MTLGGAAAGFRPWTDAEKAIVRERYEAEGAHKLGEVLGRSWHGVFRMASRLGGLQRKRRWGTVDDRRLKTLWLSSDSLESIAGKLGRTPLTTYWRAYELDLPLGAPAGYEYLSAAATRTGYETSQLRVILGAAGVAIRPVRARTSKKRKSRAHFVDPFDVDRAVEAWLQLETVECAARRLGIGGDNLRRWLREAGHDKPPRKYTWRLPPEVFDELVAARRSRVSVRSAAMELGLCPTTLRAALLRARVPRPPGKLWLVTLADCYRALGLDEAPAELARAA